MLNVNPAQIGTSLGPENSQIRHLKKGPPNRPDTPHPSPMSAFYCFSGTRLPLLCGRPLWMVPTNNAMNSPFLVRNVHKERSFFGNVDIMLLRHLPYCLKPPLLLDFWSGQRQINNRAILYNIKATNHWIGGSSQINNKNKAWTQ